MPYHYILVDAHPIDRLNCLQVVQKYEEFSCAGEFSNALDALAFIKENTIDFIIVSKKLPVYDGFEFIQQLQQLPPILFFTQKTSDALLAYEHGVFDCMLKPLSKKRFEKSLQRLLSQLQLQEQVHQVKAQKFTVKSNLQTFHIDSTKILWIESAGDYVKIILPKETHLVHSTLKKIVEELPGDYFIQIHKSYVVNLNHIESVNATQVKIRNNYLPLSRRRKATFMERFNQLV
ncbi:MAG: LytR/AlgR family response regulator transcription factor [Flavobacteriaceae bacterium]